MVDKIKLYFDALLYGDSLTKRYLYGIIGLSLGALILSILAVSGFGIMYGLGAVFFAVTDLIWWQSMTLTSDELEKQGDKEVFQQKKLEKKQRKCKEIAVKKEKKKLQKEKKEIKKSQDKLDKENEKSPQKSKKKEGAFEVSKDEVKYILKRSRVKKDHREVIIERSEKFGLTEAPAYLWKDRKKYHLLVIGDGEPLKLSFPLSYNSILVHENAVKSFPDKEYLRFKYPSFISMVFEPFLPDYYEKSIMDGTAFYKNLYCLDGDIYFTNTSAKNVFDITGANFKVADEVTKEDAHGEGFVNVYKANILWRDGVISSKEYKDRVTYLLSNLAKADIGFDEFKRILTRMYEYNLITKAYVEFYIEYRKKYKTKNK